MRQNKILAGGLFIALGLLIASDLVAATYFVAPSGNDTNSGGSATTALRTLKRAASLAVSGDRVHVAAGEYPESFNIIGKQGAGQLQFIASGPGSVVIGGQINVVDSNGVVLTGFKFAGNSDRFLTWQGSYDGTLSGCEFIRGRNALLMKSGSLVIDNCTLRDFASDGIEVDGVAKLVVNQSRISGCQGSAIKILKKAYVAVDGSDISDNLGDGVRVAVTTDSIPVTSGSCNCTGSTPQSMKREAYDLLAGVNPMTEAYRQAIDDARNAILGSLSPALWQDEWTATSAGGPTIYDRSESAIELLNAVYTDNIDFFISGDDVIVNQPFKLSLKVLGAEISNGSLYDVPVTTSAKVGTNNYEPWGSFNSPTQGNVNDNSNPRDFADTETHPPGTNVSISGRSWLKVSNSNSGTSDSHWNSYLTVSSSSQSGNLKVLRDGDAIPNLAGYGGQASAASFLGSYIEDGRIKLAKNQAIFLFELGTTNLSSSAADFQDLVVLLTMQPTNSNVTPEEAELILQAILLLLESDKNLASCAISQAQCVGGNVDAIAEAESYFNTALVETAADHFLQATKDYKAAWEAAQQALLIATGSGTVSSTGPKPPSNWTVIEMPKLTVSSSTMTGNNSSVAMFDAGIFEARNSDFSRNRQWGTQLRGEVTMEDCTISENDTGGLQLTNTFGSNFSLSHTTVSDNGTYGVFCSGSTLTFSATTLDSSTISGSKTLFAGYDSTLTFAGLTISGGSQFGIANYGGSVAINDCILSDNDIGLYSDDHCSGSGSTFTGNTTTGASVLGTATFTNCVFENNPNGLQITNGVTGAVELVGSQIQNNAFYGVWCDACTLTFDATMQAGWNVQNNGSNFGATGSTLTFNDFTISNGTTYGIVTEQGTLNLNSSTLTGNGTGAFVDASGTLIASDTKFTNNTLYGAAIHGNASLQNCTLDHNTHGLLFANMTAGQFTSVGTTVSNNSQSGLHLDSCTLTLTGNGMDGLTLLDNQHGIYSTNSTLVFDNFSSTSNTYGAWLASSNVTMTNSKFTGSAYGLWATNNNSLSVDSSTFTGNSSYGVYLFGNGSFHNCSITGNGNGLYVNATDVTDATLSGTEISGNSGYGVYVYSASLALGAQSAEGWSIDSNGYNVAGHQADISLLGAKMTDATNYGVFAEYGSVNLQQSTIASKSAGVGGYYTTGFTVDRSLISGSTTGRGVVNVNGGLTMRNTVVSGADTGVYSTDSSKPVTIYNSTIANASLYGIYVDSGDLTVMNTIISGTNGTYGLYRGPSANVAHSHNLVSGFGVAFENTTADATELLKPPRFLDPASGDFRLSKGSPAINAGSDLSASHSIDILGNSRPSHKVFEIGAYEYIQDGGSLRVLDWQEKR